MLGKDYMLAIVLVNCDDNLWSDQSLETDPDLPPGWRKICDSLGTYYWHVPTGTTQWQHPACTTSPGGHTEADGEETLQGRECQAPAAKHSAKDRPIPSPMASLSRRHSLSWHGDDFQHSAEPGSKCFAVRSLGWVEIPEEDLAPGKSSIAVNNCIQQLSNSKGQSSAENQGEGQDLVMILKKDTMSLVDPLDRSLIHRQPILNIRVWGVGCNNGRDRDFAFVASDKDTCVLKCHVFHCNVPAKGIAKALHEMCSKIVAERAVASSRLPRAATLEPISAEDLPLQVDILEAVRQSMQTYEALYIGSLPVPRAMGMDVLNEAIEKLTRRPGRENWTPSLIYVSDTAMRVHPAQVGRAQGAAAGAGTALPPGQRTWGAAGPPGYVKPGNQERGWNDPPQFSYGLQAQAGGSRRTPLTRRAAPPPAGALPGAPPDPPSAPSDPAAPPPRALGPPPQGAVGAAPRTEGRPSAACPEQEECSVSADTVLAPLRAALDACRATVQKQVCNDIGRRLTVLEDAWAQGKLSAPVRKRMSLLVQELQQQHWDAADEIHRSLMVDHVNEVSQWMVGVKRLIAETRDLPTGETTDGSADTEPTSEPTSEPATETATEPGQEEP
ncbi:amyloid-beta A4 precursor protein-binding family B member 3-like [Corvus kubaryi]|uniref:amyloid-beta A4 precursor protein-binding family B member 3-like n=1 Tax=Corvus kubaryi TaxID=68294 RepID=UPI001C03F710|nr:amyloid-beta A4 precursor protein-binding family B member 3-like [Corvus kubaryi]